MKTFWELRESIQVDEAKTPYQSADHVKQLPHTKKFAGDEHSKNSSKGVHADKSPNLTMKQRMAHHETSAEHDQAARHHEEMAERAKEKRDPMKGVSLRSVHKKAAQLHRMAGDHHLNSMYDDATHHDVHMAHHVGNRANEFSRHVQTKFIKKKMKNESVELDEVSSSLAKRAMKKRIERQAASYTTQASYNRKADKSRAKRDALLKKADALPDHHKPRSSGGDLFKGSAEHEKLTKKAQDHNVNAHYYSKKAKEAEKRGDEQGNKIGRSQDRAYPKLGKALKANPDHYRANRIADTQVKKMRDKHFATTADYDIRTGKEIKKAGGKQHSQYPKKTRESVELDEMTTAKFQAQSDLIARRKERKSQDMARERERASKSSSYGHVKRAPLSIGPKQGPMTSPKKDPNSPVAQAAKRRAERQDAMRNKGFGPRESTNLDEISDKTLDAYRKKAIKSYNKSIKYFDSPSHEKKPETKAKHQRNLDKRLKGIDSTYKRDMASKRQRFIHKPTRHDDIESGKRGLTNKPASSLAKSYKDRDHYLDKMRAKLKNKGNK